MNRSSRMFCFFFPEDRVLQVGQQLLSVEWEHHDCRKLHCHQHQQPFLLRQRQQPLAQLRIFDECTQFALQRRRLYYTRNDPPHMDTSSRRFAPIRFDRDLLSQEIHLCGSKAVFVRETSFHDWRFPYPISISKLGVFHGARAISQSLWFGTPR